MKNNDLYNLALKVMESLPPQENCSIYLRDSIDKEFLREGRHELGSGKWIDENVHININERCDTKTVFFKNSDFCAISFAHHHRQGWRGSLFFYKKKD